MADAKCSSPSGDTVIAYGHLDLQPPYPPFAERRIPAISDLVVAEHARRRGLATRLISSFQDMARERACAEIGVGVGLYKDYGAAQRLYAKLSYIPDGRSITCRETPVDPGASYRVDDDLVLQSVFRRSGDRFAGSKTRPLNNLELPF